MNIDYFLFDSRLGGDVIGFAEMCAHEASVPDGTCVYAVGDIHGRHDLLRDLQRRIAGDAAARDAGRRVVVYLGDYVDRGPDSRAVIETLATVPLPGFESVHLRGNHETLLREFLDDVAVAPLWFENGGDSTLASYGVTVGHDAPLDDLQAAFRAALPPVHKAFLDGLALSHVEGGYAFVHAGIRPGAPLAVQREDDLIWIRDEFLDATADHGHVVVHGHSIAWTPEIRSNRIAIDTGAFLSGTLTALVLEGATRDFLQTTD